MERAHLPLGRAVWTTAAVELPPGAPTEWHDAITGLSLRAIKRSGRLIIRAADLFGHFPVAFCTSSSS